MSLQTSAIQGLRMALKAVMLSCQVGQTRRRSAVVGSDSFPADSKLRVLSPPLEQQSCSLQLVKITRAQPGIAGIDALVGHAGTVVDEGIDSEFEPGLEVLVEDETFPVYEWDLELISMT